MGLAPACTCGVLSGLLVASLPACDPAAREPAAAPLVVDTTTPEGGGLREGLAADAGATADPSPDAAAPLDEEHSPDAPGGVIVAAPPHDGRPELTLSSPARARLAAAARRCYARALKDAPKLSGRLVIELEADGRGKISAARSSARSTVANPALESCVVAAVRSVAAQPTDDGTPSKSAVTFVFKPE